MAIKRSNIFIKLIWLKRQRDRETERQRDRETERRRDRETERQRDRETEIRFYRNLIGLKHLLMRDLTSNESKVQDN
jgi:hypothetical protein